MAGDAPRRNCGVCGRQFRAPVADRAEVNCSRHRPVGPVREPVPLSIAPPVVPAEPGPSVGRLEVATLAELAAVDRDGSPLGTLLLKLAREVDESAGVSAARVAAEYCKVRVEALAGTETPVADVIDLIFGEQGA